MQISQNRLPASLNESVLNLRNKWSSISFQSLSSIDNNTGIGSRDRASGTVLCSPFRWCKSKLYYVSPITQCARRPWGICCLYTTAYKQTVRIYFEMVTFDVKRHSLSVAECLVSGSFSLPASERILGFEDHKTLYWYHFPLYGIHGILYAILD